MGRGPSQERQRPGILTIVIGIGAVALCCFGPILVASLGAAGLGAVFRQYSGYFLLIAAVIVVLVGILSYRRWKSGSSNY